MFPIATQILKHGATMVLLVKVIRMTSGAQQTDKRAKPGKTQRGVNSFIIRQIYSVLRHLIVLNVDVANVSLVY